MNSLMPNLLKHYTIYIYIYKNCNINIQQESLSLCPFTAHCRIEVITYLQMHHAVQIWFILPKHLPCLDISADKIFPVPLPMALHYVKYFETFSRNCFIVSSMISQVLWNCLRLSSKCLFKIFLTHFLNLCTYVYIYMCVILLILPALHLPLLR